MIINQNYGISMRFPFIPCEMFERMTEGDAYGNPCSINGSPYGLHHHIITVGLTFLLTGWGFCIKIDKNDVTNDLNDFKTGNK